MPIGRGAWNVHDAAVYQNENKDREDGNVWRVGAANLSGMGPCRSCQIVYHLRKDKPIPEVNDRRGRGCRERICKLDRAPGWNLVAKMWSGTPQSIMQNCLLAIRPHFSNTTHPPWCRDFCMALQMRSAALANTTAAFRPRHRGIDTALRCAAKTNTPPSIRRHQLLSDDLKGLVSDLDAGTPLGRALQNDRATLAYVAEIHTAGRSAYCSLTRSAASIEAAAASP